MPNWSRSEFDWDEANEDHILRHAVYPEEVEQAFANNALIRRRGSVYQVYGQDDEGRYLFIVCVRRDDRVRVVTAPPMARKEQRFYERHR